jgi:hypothetical protein
MADFLPSFVGGALGRMFGSAAETPPAPAGGLANAPAREEVAPIAMPETPEAARQDLYKEMNSLRKVQSDLLRSLEARSTPNASDTLFAISRGLLAPNPTGQFGVAFGNAVGEMQGQRAQQDAAAQQLSKMRLEMGQSNIGMAEKGIEFAKESQALKLISDAFGATPAATAQALASGTVPGGDLSRITPALYMSVAQASPKLAEALKNAFNMDVELGKNRVEQAKLDIERTKPVKVYIPEMGGTFEITQDEYAKYKQTGVMPTIGAGRKSTAVAGVSTPVVAVAAPTLSSAAPATSAAPTATAAAAPAAAVTPTAVPLSIEQREAQAKGSEAEFTARGKAAGEASADLQTSYLQSDDIISLAREADSIATTNPGAFKSLLSKDKEFRDWYDGILAAARKGIQTPFGSFSIPTEVVQRNVLGDKDIAALQKFAQIEAQFTLFGRRIWLKGQGAISNGESEVVAQIGPQALDRPEVIRMKSEAVSEKAKFDQRSYEAWVNFQDSNPGKGFQSFLVSKDFKSLRDEYVDRLKQMREANARFFSSTSTPAAPAASAARPSLQQQLAAERQRRAGATQ